MAPSTPLPHRPTTGPWARRDVLIVALVILVLALWTGSDATLTDPFWMAREGLDVLSGGGWSHHDRWGATSAQHVFIPTSPLWQVWLGMAWAAAGSTGLLLASAGGIALTLAAVAMTARRLGATPLGVNAALAILALVPAAVTIRPTTPAIGLLLAVLIATDTLLARTTRPLPAIASLVLLTSTLGIWLHASWVVYGPLSGIAAAVLWSQHRSIRSSPIPALMLTASGFAGACLGPRGAWSWSDARRIQVEMEGVITEWISPWEHPTTTAWLWLWLLLIAFTGLAIVSAWRQRQQGTPLEWIVLGLACVLLGGAAYALRLVPQAAVLLAPWLALKVSGSVAPPGQGRVRGWQDATTARSGRAVSALIACLLLPMAAAGAVPPYPQLRDAAFARLPAGCRLLTDAATANLVLLARMDVRPWLDGRADMWGREHLLQSFGYLAGTALEPVPAGIDCVLQRQGRANALTARLDGDRSWRSIDLAGSELRLWVHR